MRAALLASILAISATASALPPGAAPALREGANHRAGDDSFVAAFGRLPTHADAEALRMKVHLQHTRARLGRLPATRPELASKRAELLGYLDDYIAAGLTPVNTRLPWRSPVFIDEHGHICAVGYLIERSVGRALPERIARRHRHDFLEDIAAAMPEVRAWIASSGLTLDELASIQPGYAKPEVEAWGRIDHVALRAGDGAYRDDLAGGHTKGTLRRGNMEGTWTRSIDDKVVGKGTFRRGAGTWRSYDRDGNLIARGSFANNHPHGRWTLYHASGNVAAIGSFRRGLRHGAWQFFHDTRTRTPIATGSFVDGAIATRWRHYDARGKLLAVTRRGAPLARTGADTTSRGSTLMTIVPGRDGVRHQVHSFGGMDSRQLHLLVRGKARLYVDGFGSTIYDANGDQLRRTEAGWTAAPCGWSKKRKAIAAAGDVSTLARLLRLDDHREGGCTGERAVSKARAASIEATLGSLGTLRAPTPAFVRALVLAHGHGEGIHLDYAALTAGKRPAAASSDPDAPAHDPDDNDLVRVLAASLSWYTEWPHIDGRFIALFPTIAGFGRTDDLPRVDPE